LIKCYIIIHDLFEARQGLWMFGFGSNKDKREPPEALDPVLDPVALMPRGRGDETHVQIRDKEIPSASWAKSVDVVRLMRYNPDRFPGQLFLGKVGNIMVGTRPRVETYADETRAFKAEDRHILTVAGSRAGKSMSMILPNLLDYQGAALVSDPKAELADKTALRRAVDLGQDVFVLDPFGKASQEIKDAGLLASFNPLSMLSDPETLVEDADLIADALVIQGGNDPHWDESAKRVIQGVILHVATFPRYGRKRNLCTVRDLLNFGATVDPRFITADQLEKNAHLWRDGEPPRGMAGLFYEMLCNDGAANVINAVAFDMAEKPDKERDSILSSARRQTSFLDLPRMRAVLMEGTFPRTIPDLSILKTAKNGATIYLCLPAGYMRICSRWLRLFVDLALKAMERTDKIKPEAPVLFCLDEFPVLGYMPQIEAAAGQLASFDVRLWPIVQDLTQLKALYGERWETFIGNAAVVQLFGTSDLTTLRYMSELVGKEARSVTSGSAIGKDGRDSGQTGLSWSVQTFDLLPVHEARTMFDRGNKRPLQLLLYQGLDPIIAERIIYSNESVFQGKERKSVTEPLENIYNFYMSSDDLNNIEYQGNPYELLGRQLRHSDGTFESAVMNKIYWDYFDWLFEIGAIISIQAMLKELDFERGNRPLGEALSSYLYEGAEHRKALGLPNPPWMII
jgi:type IV secretion system protein VirD4